MTAKSLAVDLMAGPGLVKSEPERDSTRVDEALALRIRRREAEQTSLVVPVKWQRTEHQFPGS